VKEHKSSLYQFLVFLWRKVAMSGLQQLFVWMSARILPPNSDELQKEAQERKGGRLVYNKLF